MQLLDKLYLHFLNERILLLKQFNNLHELSLVTLEQEIV